MGDNFKICKSILEALLSLDVREVYICSGKRNLPLAKSLDALKRFKIYTHFEERAAAFFCLGRIKKTRRPVALLTTSGTAVGEVLPAMMEASFSGLPLLAVTADRPKNYRGTGAPQSCYQNDIFKHYTGLFFDLDKNDYSLKGLKNWNRHSPLHINACFEEPVTKEIPSFLSKISKKPLQVKSLEVASSKMIKKFLDCVSDKKANIFFIVGKLAKDDAREVKKFFLLSHFKAYFEAHSTLRNDKSLQAQSIYNPKEFFRETQAKMVIRLGHVPTHRIWRDLEEMAGKIQVLSVNSLNFKGLSFGETIACDVKSFFKTLNEKIKNKKAKFKNDAQTSHSKHHAILSLIEKYPKAEQSLIHKLSLYIPKKSNIYLGNSSPIRHFDEFATYSDRGFLFENSRGLNGIDGQISTFLGFSMKSKTESWGIFGDLTALYDLASPWVMPWMTGVCLRIVIINNFGGQIFSGLKDAKLMTNSHGYSFKEWAKQWGLSYKAFKDISQKNILSLKKEPYVLEVLPDKKETALFERTYKGFYN